MLDAQLGPNMTDMMIDKVMQDFIERMGLIAQGDGLPRIAGRIFGLFVIKEQTYSFSELSQLLQVSRASISTNTRLLENLGVLERTSKAGERQDFFRLRKKPYLSVLRSMQSRLSYASEVVNDTSDNLPERLSDAKNRLQELSSFYSALHQACEDIIVSNNSNK